MITAAQCRAARGFLDWSLSDLALASGLSRASLSAFEQDTGNPKNATLRQIANAFEEAGVELTPEPGLRLKGQKLEVRRMDGPNVVELLLDDIYETCLRNGGDILLSGLDESTFNSSPHDQDLMRRQIRRLREQGMKERVILKEGDRHFTFPPDITAYRWIDPKLFGLVPTILYGDKHAIVVFDAKTALVITQNAQVATTYRQQFEVLWSLAKVIPFTDDEVAMMCERNLPLADKA